MNMQIVKDGVHGEQIIELLREHLRHMAQVSPPESTHALNLDGLRAPEVTMWTAWEGQELLGCGALKELDINHGEIKSMRTAKAHVRKGVAARLLQHMIEQANLRGYARISLETGSMSEFVPAQKLYEGFGFEYCAPFADYRLDPNSVFMTRLL